MATPGTPAGGGQRTDRDGKPLAADVPIAVARVALLSPTEAWLEGIRVDPRVRGMEVATELQVAELSWAAGKGATVVRYATGAANEASHRLGARHGFELLVALRTWWWRDPALAGGEDDERDEGNGFDEAARKQATKRRRAALEALARRGLRPAPGAAAALWPRVAADPTFNAGQRLYEIRPWGLAELTEPRFAEHARRGEVVVVDSSSDGWALAILEREAQPSEDVSFHLSLLVGDGRAGLRLAETVREAVGESIRFRLPDPSPPLLRGVAEAFSVTGYVAREWTLHILARAVDAALPPPAMDRGATIG